MEKTVSVIIPVYNVEKYLAECVDSVLGQTYKNLEIILVDDGSTDTSGKMCDEYAEKDERVRVIHKKNGGLSSARNAGIEVCRGEYLCFLDSDDLYVPDAVRILLDKACAESADTVFFNAYSFADDAYEGRITQGYGHKHDYKTDSGVQVTKKLLENKEFRYSSCLIFINSSYLKGRNILFYEGIINEDMLFTFKAMLCAETVGYIPDKLYHRRVREMSIMTTKKTELSYKSSLSIYYDLCELAKNLHGEARAVTELYISQNAVRVFNKYKALDNEEKKRYKDAQNSFKAHVLENAAYGDRALKYKCKSELLWFCFKVIKKVFG